MTQYEWVITSIRAQNEALSHSHVTQIAARLPWMWAMSHIWMRHVTYMNKSCHTRVIPSIRVWNESFASDSFRYVYPYVCGLDGVTEFFDVCVEWLIPSHLYEMTHSTHKWVTHMKWLIPHTNKSFCHTYGKTHSTHKWVILPHLPFRHTYMQWLIPHTNESHIWNDSFHTQISHSVTLMERLIPHTNPYVYANWLMYICIRIEWVIRYVCGIRISHTSHFFFFFFFFF